MFFLEEIYALSSFHKVKYKGCVYEFVRVAMLIMKGIDNKLLKAIGLLVFSRDSPMSSGLPANT